MLEENTQSPASLEKILEYGAEGGRENIYRIASGKIFAHGSSFAFDENGKAITNKWIKEYSSWKEFWNKFTKGENWFCFYPIFIHTDCKKDIRQSIDKLHISEDRQYYIEEWLAKL